MKSSGSGSLWRVHTLTVLTFSVVIGAGTGEWVQDLFRTAKHDAWLSVLIAGILGGLLGSMLVWALTFFPEASAGSVLTRALGSWLGGLLNLGFVFYTLATAAWFGRSAVEMLHFAVLPRTPSWTLLALPVLIAAVVIQGGVDAVLRYQYMMIWPALLTALLSVGLGFRMADWGNFFPVLGDGLGPAIRGVRHMVEPILGLELLLVFLPYFRQKGVTTRQALGAIWGATAVVLFVYLYLIVSLLVGFGPFEAAELTWPLLEAVRRVFLTGIVFERLDIVFLITLLVAASTALNRNAFAGLETLRHTLSLRHRPWHGWVCLLAVWAMGLLPENLAQLDWWRERVLEPLGLIYLIGVPVLLVCAGLVRRYRRRAYAVTS